ncbi:multiple PDZ domain protein-like isoform X1 [Takifugu rubripes]|uniref:multiple PDZ domain protein-like isoform X1 n=2 Tax=Takifugu rubripes TaxID=31033 RepID=UPI001145C9EA|nr:multiple PDZ domain protein-like isoform X1 [Takifugu rubripes]
MIGRPRVAVNYDHWLLKPFGGDFNTAKEHYWQGPYVEGSNEDQRSDARDLCFVCLQEPSVHVSATVAKDNRTLTQERVAAAGASESSCLAGMELMDTRRALEAVERLQARLKERGETPTQEKLSLLKIVLHSPLFHHILSLQQAQQKPLAKLAPAQAKVSKSVSLNRGPCGGVLQGLSHSDSYTWAVEHRRPGSGRSMNREGSFSSLSSQEMSLTNEITDYTHTESQYCTPPRVSRTMSMGRNLAALAQERRYIEMIELTNDGKGLGFGIVGGRSTGVMVKTILPGGAAGQDKRLRSGDQILRIGDTDLAGMSSEQVAQVLRNAGSRVKLMVARDVRQEGRSSCPAFSRDGVDSKVNNGDQEFSVDLPRRSQGLGFTISTYIGDLNSVYSAGVVVKSIEKDGGVDRDGRIHVGDVILSVDGVSLQGCSEQRAMEVLRRAGPLVRLRLLRRAFRLSPALPPVPPLHPLRHSHSCYEMDFKKKQQPGVFPTPPPRICSLRELAWRAAFASRWLRHASTNDVKLTAAEEEDLRWRWQRAVGPRYEVSVCQLERFGETSGLGFSLEARAGHHYVRSILPEGPVGQSGKISLKTRYWRSTGGR